MHGDAKLSVGQEAVFFHTSRSRDRLPVTSPSALQMVGETATGAHSSPQVAHLISLAQSVFFVNETNARGEVSLRQDLDGLVFYAPQADTLSLGFNADESQPTLWSLNSLRAHVKALAEEVSDVTYLLKRGGCISSIWAPNGRGALAHHVRDTHS